MCGTTIKLFLRERQHLSIHNPKATSKKDSLYVTRALSLERLPWNLLLIKAKVYAVLGLLYECLLFGTSSNHVRQVLVSFRQVSASLISVIRNSSSAKSPRLAFLCYIWTPILITSTYLDSYTSISITCWTRCFSRKCVVYSFICHCTLAARGSSGVRACVCAWRRTR